MNGTNYIANAQSNHMTGRVEIRESDYRRATAGKRFDDDTEQANANAYIRDVIPELQQLHNDFELVNAAYDQAIADAKAAGDGELVAKLKGEQRELVDAYRMCVDRPPGMHRDSAEYADMWDARLDRLADAVDAGFVSLDGKPDAVVATGLEPASVRHETVSATNQGSSEGTSSRTFDRAEMDQMVDNIIRDPAAVMNWLEGMTPEQRSAALMAIQQNLQHINQMHSMMSNFQKSIHDTQKAVLSNFRV